MAKLVVNLENVSEVLKKKIDYVLPPELSKDLSKLFDKTISAQKEGKKRLNDFSKKLSHYPFLAVLTHQAKSFVEELPDHSEKILHYLGIPTLKDFDKLSKKVDHLSKSRSTSKKTREVPEKKP